MSEIQTTPHTVTVPCPFCQAWNRIEAARIVDRPKCGDCGKPILLDRPFALREDTFHRVIEQAQIPVFVDFYADWCGPCKMMAPAVDELAAKHTGTLLVCKLNTDQAPTTSQAFGIRGIPTVMLFRNGAKAKEQSGAIPLRALEEFVQG